MSLKDPASVIDSVLDIFRETKEEEVPLPLWLSAVAMVCGLFFLFALIFSLKFILDLVTSGSLIGVILLLCIIAVVAYVVMRL